MYIVLLLFVLCVEFQSLYAVYCILSDFGHRPRRLYVVINPTSGNNISLSVWAKVEPLFRLANVHTEVFGK